MVRPTQLFHCYPERAKSFFHEWRLWFSALTDLNDPFEGMPSFVSLVARIVEDTLKKEFVFQNPCGPSWQAFKKKMETERKRATEDCLRALAEKFRRISAQHFRFFCFTAKMPNAAMWGHYADCHRGFTVEFHPEHPLFRDLKKVDYEKSRPEPEQPGDFRHLQVKGESWCAESEYRLIKPVGNLQEAERMSDATRHCYVPLSPEAVKAVYLGWQMSSEARNQIITDLGSRPIQKYVMVPHLSEYALEAWPIDEVEPLADDIRQALKL